MSINVLVIGESCRDIFKYGRCVRLCPEAPVPVFDFVQQTENDGMAFNVYNNVKSLGANADIITNKNWTQITKTRFVDISSNHMFMRYDEGDKQYGRCDISNLQYDKYDAIIISDYNKGFISKEQIQTISENHDFVFLDTKKTLGSWCEGVDFIKINELEYTMNSKYVDENLKKKVIITLGSKGARYNDVSYPVSKVEIRDVAGAGDSFISGFSVKYIQTKDVYQSIQYANKCATIVVQKKGVSVAGGSHDNLD